MSYQLYRKKGFCNKTIDIYYGSDGTVCEFDGQLMESWKPLPSGKWIKQRPDWVPGEVVHRTRGPKMDLELVPQEVRLSFLGNQGLDGQEPLVQSEQGSSKSSLRPFQLRGQSQQPYQQPLS